MEEENRRKTCSNGDSSSSGWETIYCSLALILVAFFAMLVSYSSVEGAKMTNFLRGFGSEPTKMGVPGPSYRLLGSGRQFDAGSEYMGKGSGSKTESGDAYMGRSPEFSADDRVLIARSLKDFKEFIRQNNFNNSVTLTETPQGFKAVFESSLLFDSGSATIKEKMYSCLNHIAREVINKSFFIRIEGHTDNVPISTEDFPSNWELSATRSVNVLRYFLETGKISADRLAAVGYGEYQPIGTNETVEGRKKNRRVEIYFEIESV